MTYHGKKFGQSQRMTVLIRQLIRNYTRGLGILKEFLQNADDAGATRVEVWIDWRDHQSVRMPDARMRVFGGPSLLIANDREFTDRDIEAIQRVGDGSKRLSGSKTGRFGLGFNTSYNVTDHPSFVTGDTLYCMDPHASAVTTDGTGGAWSLEHAWQEFPDWPALFAIGGLAKEAVRYPGTIFRLPLRDAAQAAVSEIAKRPFTREDVEEILRLAGENPASLLLFARHLRSLTITEVSGDGVRERLRVATLNVDDVESARRPLLAVLGDDLKDCIHRWRANPSLVPALAGWRHQLEISVDAAASHQESWHVTAGLVRGDQDRLLDCAHAMIEEADESAIPWVGAAALITSSTPSRPRGLSVAGALHCTFSLPPPVALPVHVNGFFDLDDSRQRLTIASKDSGATQRIRGAWNHALLAEGCARAWVHLLTALAAGDVEGLYDLWPDPAKPHDALTKAMIDGFYQLARTAPLIRVREHGKHRWATSAELRVLPAQAGKDLQDALLADGLALPDPPLPEHVRCGLAPTELEPADLRRMLRDTPVFRGPLVKAPRPSLTRPEWIEAMLVYCWSDGQRDLADLPLALTCDDELRAFGKTTIFLPEDSKRALFPNHPGLFLTPRLAKHLAEVKQVHLLVMTPGHVVKLLKHVVGEIAHQWNPDSETTPNGVWLSLVFNYLAEHRLDTNSLTVLRSCAILPGHDGQLHPAAERPSVILAAGGPPTLLARLRALGVVTIAAPPMTEAALAAMLQRIPNFVATITGSSVVEALSTHAEALAEIDRKAASELLDWLASVELTKTERQALAQLPLLPTNSGQRRAVDKGVYLPAGFRPPPLGTTSELVEAPPACSSLIRQLGVASLQPHTYIRQQLVPVLASLSPDSRTRAWSWLRDEVPGLLRTLEEETADDLRDALVAVPAFPASGGSLKAISALYDPESELVREVLGDSAAFPDPEAIRDGYPRWLDFLRCLRIPHEPSLGDVLRHLRDLGARGISATDPIRRIFKYFEQNWVALAGREIPGGRVKLQRWLSEEAWLPPLLKHASPGFIIPEAKLYRPNELYTDVALVGSQAPVCAWSVESRMAEAIGLRRVPSTALVLRHFEHILDTFPAASSSSEDLERHAKGLPPVYRYLERLYHTRERRVDPDEPGILARLRERPCLWDALRRRTWLPAHVFIDDVRKLEPLRTSLTMLVPEGTVRYLGGKQYPEAADYRAWMHDLAALVQDELAPEQRLQALHVLRHVGDPAEFDDLPLLCSDGRLRLASAVFIDDAPWLKERPADLHCVDPEVPISLVLGLNVPGIADALQEQLQSVETGGVTPEAIEVCKTLQARLRSPEFAAGLLRLIRHTHGPNATIDLTSITRLNLRPVTRLRTSFVLQGREVSNGDARHFFQTSDATLMLVGHQESRLVAHVARAVQQLLGADMQIIDSAPLEHILLCEPGSIEEVLDEDRVRNILYEEHSEEAEAPPNTPQQPASAASGDDAAFVDSDEADVDPFDQASAGEPELRPAASTPTPGAAVGRPTTSGGDRFKSRLAQIAAELADRPSQPPGRSITEHGLSIPRNNAAFRRTGGIQPGLQSRVSAGEVPEEVTREVEERALALVMAAELAAGRDPERMAKDHPGFNIVSRDPAERTILRYIEVKGTRRDWREQPIRLTPYQVADALREPAKSWLYIVERLDGTPRLRKIPAFVEHIVGFTVDAESWAPLCESAPPPSEPREGHELHGRDGLIGIIRAVQGGKLVVLTVEPPGGEPVKLPFRPSEHSLKEPDDGEDVSCSEQ